MSYFGSGSSPEEERLLSEALDGVDFSALSTSASDQYPLISGKEITTADETAPLRGLLMRAGNAALKDARSQAEGEKSRLPESRNSGWSLSIETPNGYVGLWSCWLENRFYLGFPK